MGIPPTPVEVVGLSKQFGRRNAVLAVDDLSFRVEPGRITGFLGPNGAGKTTTLRCLLGLVRPTAGTALIGDRPYEELAAPTTVVGAALESSGFHPARSARNHLLARAVTVGRGPADVDRVLDFVGLSDAKDRKAGQFSLGMRQRLSLAMALLPDPAVLLLDEPANGLDPAGIAWLRSFLRGLAGEGRTILVSSHLLAEVRQTVDDVVIVDQGRLVRSGPLAQLVLADGYVRVAGPDLAPLLTAVDAAGGRSTAAGPAATIAGLTAAQVGALAFRAGVELHELTVQEAALEDVFLQLTTDRQQPTGGSAS